VPISVLATPSRDSMFMGRMSITGNRGWGKEGELTKDLAYLT
jgi:hypothetical protein